MHSSHIHQVAHLQQRVNQLEHEIERIREHMSFKLSSDDLADFQNRIEDFIEEQKSAGRTIISILEISHQLSIPVEYVDKIMKKLESKGVKEVE
jgi:predicted  nucleic acid-binding Zn-ribbon protein